MRKSFIKTTVFCAGLGLAALAAGCSSSDTTSTTSTGTGGGSSTTGAGGGKTGPETVNLFSWWIAPGEAEALQALVDTYKKAHPDAHVTNSGTASGSDTQKQLNMDIDANPPDVFQFNAHDMPVFMMAHPGAVGTLDEFFADPTLKAAVLPDVLKEVTVEGHIASMPVGMHRENSLIYNKEVFAANKLTPPTSIAEFLDACKTLKAANIMPVASSSQGWILRIMFNEIAQGTMGAELYHDFITGVKPVTDPTVTDGLKAAMTTFGQVLTDYVDPTNFSDPDFGWTQAADAVHDGKAAMFLHGDWAKGYLVQLGWTPGVDFGQVGAPGASDFFWYGVDVLAEPTHAPHPDGAHDFLSVVASKEGQIAFNRLKGSTPMRTDVRDGLDALGQSTLDDLVNAKHRTPVINLDGWDKGAAQFAIDHDVEAFYQVYVTTHP